MTKLDNKPVTISDEQSSNKRESSFPFRILPKEKETLQFNNSAIEKYLSTFGNLRHKRIPFKVPLKSHLKGLKLQMSKLQRENTLYCYIGSRRNISHAQ